jgi:hypothetical protein
VQLDFQIRDYFGTMAMNDIDELTHRQQNLYFGELFELKVACEYMRRYREGVAIWVTNFDVLRAITSSGAIATWAVVQSYPLIWAGIIALAQVADVLKDVFPFTARLSATSGAVMSLDALFIEALFEWEGVFSGQFSNEEIADKRRKLMQLRHDIEVKHFPTGNLPMRNSLLRLAKEDAIAYLQDMFGPRE